MSSLHLSGHSYDSYGPGVIMLMFENMQEITGDPQFMVDGASRFDIQQGELGKILQCPIFLKDYLNSVINVKIITYAFFFFLQEIVGFWQL